MVETLSRPRFYLGAPWVLKSLELIRSWALSLLGPNASYGFKGLAMAKYKPVYKTKDYGWSH
jgi:hypothetical protein